MSLPSDREQLRECWKKGQRFQFLFFYGHKPPIEGVDASCFSQWFVRAFNVDGIQYPTAEHWMMAEKARLFGDDEMLEQILACESPKEAKAFGRKVQNFDPDIWNQHKFEIVCRGNLEKFTQHEDFKQYLLATTAFVAPQNAEADDPASDETELVRERPATYRKSSAKSQDVILVEAAGRDVIWGIGLGKSNPKAANPLTWRGRNLLGFALTRVRETISNQSAN